MTVEVEAARIRRRRHPERRPQPEWRDLSLLIAVVGFRERLILGDGEGE
jgi:hypothetical protein